VPLQVWHPPRMGFLDKAKAAAGQAAGKAKAGVEDLQAKVDLGAAYDELGKTTFELIERGEVAHPKLDEAAEKIRTLRARAADGDEAAPAPDAPEPPQPHPDAPAT